MLTLEGDQLYCSRGMCNCFTACSSIQETCKEERELIQHRKVWKSSFFKQKPDSPVSVHIPSKDDRLPHSGNIQKRKERITVQESFPNMLPSCNMNDYMKLLHVVEEYTLIISMPLWLCHNDSTGPILSIYLQV